MQGLLRKKITEIDHLNSNFQIFKVKFDEMDFTPILHSVIVIKHFDEVTFDDLPPSQIL